MAWPAPGPVDADTLTGAAGAPKGKILFDGVDAALVPIALVAVTEKVYDVPLVSPVTVIGELRPVMVIPPGLDVVV